MYENYFQLSEKPFSIAPNPRFLFLSQKHQESLAHLEYGIAQGGCFIVLTGEVGTGKTTICHKLLEKLDDSINTGLILNPTMNAMELLQVICKEFGIAFTIEASQRQLIDNIHKKLLEEFSNNHRNVLIIDEAQLLSVEALEQLRLLTNLETTEEKILQIVLIGQPELNDLLSQENLRQLAQRITARYHIAPLEREEIEAYLNYRLSIAGGQRPLFSRQAIEKISELTDGIPRKLNVIADHALLSAYAKNHDFASKSDVEQGADEITPRPKLTRSNSFARSGLLLAGAIIIAIVTANSLYWFLQWKKVDAEVGSRPPLETNMADTEINQVEDTTANDEANNETAAPLGLANGDGLRSAQPEDIEEDSNASKVSTVPEELIETLSIKDLISSRGAQLTNANDALKTLLEHWNAGASTGVDDCRQLFASKYRCLGLFSWQDLVRLNRPAVMEVTFENRNYYLGIAAIAGNKSEVLVNEERYLIPNVSLRQYLGKRFYALWQPPFGEKTNFRIDENNPAVPALRQLLQRANEKLGLASLPNLGSSIYDDAVFGNVMVLQRALGIEADGLIGRQTLLRLNELVNEETLILQQRL